MRIQQHGYKIFVNKDILVDHHYQSFWPRFKTLYRRSYIYGKMVLQRRFKFDKGHGTFKEGINSFLSLLGIASLLLSAVSIYGLVAFFIIIIF